MIVKVDNLDIIQRSIQDQHHKKVDFGRIRMDSKQFSMNLPSTLPIPQYSATPTLNNDKSPLLQSLPLPLFINPQQILTFPIIIIIINDGMVIRHRYKIPYFQVPFVLAQGMAIAPVTGYIMQYKLILTNKSVGAFSIDICFVLLFANIMRINFYLFRQYQLALLFQSLFMITAQVLLVRVCTVYNRMEGKQESELSLQDGKKKDEEEEDFWRWRDFSVYCRYIGRFTVGTFILSVFMKIIEFNVYGDIIGMIALLSESVLILPQIIQIFKQQRVGGISYHLIFLNLFGDVVKTYYFFLKDQPFQFKLCGIIQLCLDSFVVFQIGYYKWKEGLTEINEQTQITDQQLKHKVVNKDLQGSISQNMRLEQNVQEIDSNLQTVTASK